MKNDQKAQGPTPEYVRANDLHSFHEGLCDDKRSPCIAVCRATDFDQLTAQVERLRGALEQALEYFENREDVIDGDYGQPAPNKEMTLAQELRSALSTKDSI